MIFCESFKLPCTSFKHLYSYFILILTNLVTFENEQFEGKSCLLIFLVPLPSVEFDSVTGRPILLYDYENNYDTGKRPRLVLGMDGWVPVR